ncbi:ATP12 family chaperone protein [Plastorhodobacter daqingensis]|uniref:ATP12 family chaperone protein n=1 Tax=Plastorhodobacter daqingensis TaxID=1387281 RepID=A0ABW2UHF5_9RHOB
MTGWKARRFWSEAVVVEREGGFGVDLDGRPLRTPAKAPLVVPSRALAVAIAAEWQAQDGEVDPRTMPITRGANAVIDKVRPQVEEVVNLLAAYIETDLICYRAEGPAALVLRQAELWDPLVAWAEALGAPLRVTSGIIPVAQPEDSVARLRQRVAGLDAFELSGFHDLVTLPGSFVIGLAALEKWASVGQLWQTARVDEDYQASVWGEDAEAAEAALLKKRAFEDAAAFVDLVRAP